MTAYRCRKCGDFWASNCGPACDGLAITSFCPQCLPQAFPRAGDAL